MEVFIGVRFAQYHQLTPIVNQANLYVFKVPSDLPNNIREILEETYNENPQNFKVSQHELINVIPENTKTFKSYAFAHADISNPYYRFIDIHGMIALPPKLRIEHSEHGVLEIPIEKPVELILLHRRQSYQSID